MPEATARRPPGPSRRPGHEDGAQPKSDALRDPRGLPAWATAVQPALVAAEQHMAGTVSAVHPGASARTLLRIATIQRHHLAALASACRDLDPSLRQRHPRANDERPGEPWTTSSPR